ncbi:MAG: hypothetical protein M0R76_10680 [Proteobacteria bacterium]|nr:hypothetical protein [Pseudomonadota bacterium]
MASLTPTPLGTVARRIVNGLLVAVVAIYPLLVYLGLTHFAPRTVALLLLALLALRGTLFIGASKANWRQLLPVGVAGLACTVTAAALQSERALLFLPVAINAIMLATFGATLWRKPSMVARFAALKEPHMTPRIVAYCDRVTLVWCGFFVFNGTAAALTVFSGSREYWTLYNGLISYVLMGLLFGIEYLVRQRVRRRDTAPSP